MKLYDSGRAPNPRRTRIFFAEKGVNVPAEQPPRPETPSVVHRDDEGEAAVVDVRDVADAGE